MSILHVLLYASLQLLVIDIFVLRIRSRKPHTILPYKPRLEDCSLLASVIPKVKETHQASYLEVVPSAPASIAVGDLKRVVHP